MCILSDISLCHKSSFFLVCPTHLHEYMNKQPLLLFILWTESYQETITTIIITFQSLFYEPHIISTSDQHTAH